MGFFDRFQEIFKQQEPPKEGESMKKAIAERFRDEVIKPLSDRQQVVRSQIQTSPTRQQTSKELEHPLFASKFVQETTYQKDEKQHDPARGNGRHSTKEYLGEVDMQDVAARNQAMAAWKEKMQQAPTDARSQLQEAGGVSKEMNKQECSAENKERAAQARSNIQSSDQAIAQSVEKDKGIEIGEKS